MALLNENEIKAIIMQARGTEVKGSRKQVPYWLMRGLCVVIGAVFTLLALLLMLGGNPAWIIFFLIGFSWLAGGIIFHLCWLRYAEAVVLKDILEKNGIVSSDGQNQ